MASLESSGFLTGVWEEVMEILPATSVYAQSSQKVSNGKNVVCYLCMCLKDKDKYISPIESRPKIGDMFIFGYGKSRFTSYAVGAPSTILSADRRSSPPTEKDNQSSQSQTGSCAIMHDLLSL